MNVQVYVEYFDTTGQYYSTRFVSHGRYTEWLNKNKGVRVMKVQVQ